MQDDDTVLADCERVLSRYHDTDEGSFQCGGACPCAPFNVTKRLMIDTAVMAEKYDCRLHTHLGETFDENAYCIEHFGCRPLDYLEEVGWMNERVWLAHGIHFNDDEMRGSAVTGSASAIARPRTWCWPPASAGPRNWRRRRAVVGLGVDGSASNDNSNLMEGVRHALMLGRLRYGAAGVTHLDAFAGRPRARRNASAASDIGTIAVGKQADLAIFTLDELRFSGAGDPLAALVLCGAHRADRVMIGGDWRVVDGAPVGVDVARLRHEHGRAAQRFLAS